MSGLWVQSENVKCWGNAQPDRYYGPEGI